MAIEQSPPRRRGFYGSIVQVGYPLGMALGTTSFFALALLDEDSFMRWGWRIPFVASAAMVAVGIFIRLRITETPEFTRDQRQGRLERFPVWAAIVRHPKDLAIGLGVRITEAAWIYVITIFCLSYAVNDLGLSPVVLGFVIAMALGHGVVYGVQASFLSEMFPSNVRYSGASLGYQLAAPIGGGLMRLSLQQWSRALTLRGRCRYC